MSPLIILPEEVLESTIGREPGKISSFTYAVCPTGVRFRYNFDVIRMIKSVTFKRYGRLMDSLLKKIKKRSQYPQYENNRIFGFKLRPYGYNQVY